jgi:transposase
MEFIEETFGVEVSISTISRTLQREKISRKKVYILAPN